MQLAYGRSRHSPARSSSRSRRSPAPPASTGPAPPKISARRTRRAFGLVFGAAAAPAGLPAEGDPVHLELATDPPLQQIALAARRRAATRQRRRPLRRSASTGARRGEPPKSALGGAAVPPPDAWSSSRSTDGIRTSRSACAARSSALCCRRSARSTGWASTAADPRRSSRASPEPAPRKLLTVPPTGASARSPMRSPSSAMRPAGPPARLAVQPLRLALLAGARVRPAAVVTDAAGHSARRRRPP